MPAVFTLTGILYTPPPPFTVYESEHSVFLLVNTTEAVVIYVTLGRKIQDILACQTFHAFFNYVRQHVRVLFLILIIGGRLEVCRSLPNRLIVGLYLCSLIAAFASGS